MVLVQFGGVATGVADGCGGSAAGGRLDVDAVAVGATTPTLDRADRQGVTPELQKPVRILWPTVHSSEPI